MLRPISSAASLPQKLLIYSSAISLLAGLLLYVGGLSLMQWIEDRVNEQELASSAPFAAKAFQQGAPEPLSIGLHVKAYYSASKLPARYGTALEYPNGYLGEVFKEGGHRFLHELLDTFRDDLENSDKEYFLYRGQFERYGKSSDLFLIMPTDNIELDDSEWALINAGLFLVIIALFGLLSYAIHKVSKRLVEPVHQLSQQLTDAKTAAFSVPPASATEFNFLAQSLNHYKQQNELMIKQEQAFARYASHELRTPLTVILGAAKLQEKKDTPEFQQRQRDRINRAAQDMQHTIDALLSLVKQEKSNHKSEIREVQETEFKNIIEPLRVEAHQKSLEVEISFHQAPLIEPSPAVLRMLLTNLVTNAIHASDSDIIRIEISKDAILVIDKGQGLTPENEQSQEGHGLGLLIVDNLCQRYGWQFDLIQGEEKGCIARLTFPLLT